MFKFSYSHIRNTNQDFIISIYKLFISFETYSLSIFAKFTFFHTMGGGGYSSVGAWKLSRNQRFYWSMGGTEPPCPPRIWLWFLYLYMSFYTSDHNRRKSLRIPDIMVCISREQYIRSPTTSPVQILNHRFKVRDAWDLISGSRSEPAVGSSAPSLIH